LRKEALKNANHVELRHLVEHQRLLVLAAIVASAIDNLHKSV